MKIAILAPVAWRTPPQHYGPWEQVASNVAEGLVAKGYDVSLFATGDSLTKGQLYSVCCQGYEEDRSQDAKVLECMHISHLMERAPEFDIIHNHFDFLPLTYSRLISTPIVTTIHGFSSEKIVPVYKRFNDIGHYVSISNADRHRDLQYAATVYNGLNTAEFDFIARPDDDYLLYLGRIHPHKGTHDAVRIAQQSGQRIIIAGIVQDEGYFKEKVEPLLDGEAVSYIGSAGPELRNKLLGNAKALLHPIHFNEPFGLSVAEAMMCGTPVIAYKRGAMAELIIDGQTGFLVNSESEAVTRVQELGHIRRRNCREHAISKFSMETMVENYIAVYEQVLNPGRLP